MIKTSAAQIVLREFILSDNALEYYAREFEFMLVRVHLATRNRAHLLIDHEIWEFRLEESQEDYAKLQLVEREYNRREDHAPEAWAFIWHHAAQAILAVREGHRAYREERERQREEREVKAA